jgi:alkanesulfonate monooxygenase SsuD/methylene tetrahydromethanopterin reductase-like flavin-dependent oxidoreductase (luciferase family)
VGGYWPEPPERIARMFEAIEIIRKLFSGTDVKHSGPFYKMETMRLWTMPAEPPPIYVATAGTITARGRPLCGRHHHRRCAESKIETICHTSAKVREAANRDRPRFPRSSSSTCRGRRQTRQAMPTRCSSGPTAA